MTVRYSVTPKYELHTDAAPRENSNTKETWAKEIKWFRTMN